MPRFSPIRLNFWANCRLALIMFEFRANIEIVCLLAHEKNEFNRIITHDITLYTNSGKTLIDFTTSKSMAETQKNSFFGVD